MVRKPPSSNCTAQQAANFLLSGSLKLSYNCRATNATAGTACWPCRQRKVKCDNQQPCENCVKREHPQLCSYKPNRSSAAKHTTTASHSRKRARSLSDGDDNVKAERQESWPPAIGKSIASWHAPGLRHAFID